MLGVGVDVSSVNKKNTHLTTGYTGGAPDVNTDQKYPGSTETKISLAETSAALAVLAWICSGIKVLGYNMEENRRRGSEKKYIR